MRKHPRKAARAAELIDASKKSKQYKNIGKTEDLTAEDVQDDLMATNTFADDSIGDLGDLQPPGTAGASVGGAGAMPGLDAGLGDDFDDELDEVL